jgi:1-aminocyclopropane-1-carboxylate deaminase
MITTDLHKIFPHLHLPSPVQQIWFDAIKNHNIQLFIKRDDLIHPTISGNKWRKLQYVLHQATQIGKTNLVSFGGAYSNHLLALACAAQLLQLRSYAFVRGECVQNHILDRCQSYGMQLHFVSRKAYLDKKTLYDTYFANDPTAFFIDEGGADAQALAGVAHIVDELSFMPDYLFLSVGTGTTLAGVAQGLAHHNFTTQLKGVLALKAPNFTLPFAIDYPHFELLHGYHGGGYAKQTPALAQLAHDFELQTHIKLDMIYNAKCLSAVIDLIQNNHIPPHSKVLMLHTGGVF